MKVTESISARRDSTKVRIPDMPVLAHSFWKAVWEKEVKEGLF